MNRRVFAGLVALMLPAALLVSPTAAAAVTTTQDGQCTDGGGHLFKNRVIWGDEYVESTTGIRKVSVDYAGISTTDPAANTIDYTVKSYDGNGTLLQTIGQNDRSWYTNGSFLVRNPVNPTVIAGKPAKIVINVGDGNDGFGNCTNTFVQPGAIPAPTIGSAAGSWGAVTAGDEFNYTGTPDSTKWSVYNGPGHSGNGTRTPANVTVNGTSLDMVGLPDGSGGGMSSKFDRTGSSGEVVGATDSGRWETRMRVYGATTADYRSSGWHPVLIVWPDAGRIASNNCQELDYAESTSDVTVMKTYNHYACPNVQHISGAKSIDMRQWHNYAVEWDANHVTTWVDGVVLYTTTDTAKTPNAASHSTIQLDNFLGALGESHLQVDWARYFAY